jgi:hypothetical protein
MKFMNAEKLWTFPVPSTNIATKVLMTYEGANVVLKFDYFDEEDNDKTYNGSVTFNYVVAFRHSDEKFTKPEYIRSSYDTLIEVRDSNWIKELMDLNREYTNQRNLRHFAIYLDSYGLYEFIAVRYDFIEKQEGTLKKDE